MLLYAESKTVLTPYVPLILGLVTLFFVVKEVCSDRPARLKLKNVTIMVVGGTILVLAYPSIVSYRP